ncbi:MAG: hypothetical protein PHO37_12075 [Kiritimatiellae bacterium]|nr:hypothetical protein [Kiritimatiellia bacterium]
MEAFKAVFLTIAKYPSFGVKVHYFMHYSLLIDEVPQASSLKENVFCKQDACTTPLSPLESLLNNPPWSSLPSSRFAATLDTERLDNKPYGAVVCCSRFSVLFAVWPIIEKLLGYLDNQ